MALSFRFTTSLGSGLWSSSSLATIAPTCSPLSPNWASSLARTSEWHSSRSAATTWMHTQRMMFLAFTSRRPELVGHFRIWSIGAKPSLACSGQCVHQTSSSSMRQAHWSIAGPWTTPGRDNHNRWTAPTSLRPSTPPALDTPSQVENQRWAVDQVEGVAPAISISSSRDAIVWRGLPRSRPRSRSRASIARQPSIVTTATPRSFSS